ncbi:MAG: hybrid sensor histidine kinase/response regulator [Candidatus Omnitrophica bacterium]|nr:hybrid sensor histidine kinase/response regulator [Candidatus Omnitrophota bacterium]MBU2044619.1 hybrid sensor histidine kinase/response regulator [Candidatus Omnitrophota bacterium]MBU2265693.1 hybrid sensor histidine kinase/response regulator [Candidatus Omnitrophota bacterium]MBU2474050.1 hybrid sensor histidine kinase/response regulator [Candidatus Omnitrophota bacterium]
MEKPRVLVVDDEVEAREFIRRYLTRNDFEVSSAGNGLLGLRLLSRNNFDVLISDINMPRMNGVEFSRRARALHPQLVIIFLTGQAALKTAQEAIKIGVHEYLAKPVELEHLKDSIQQGLAKISDRKKDLDYYRRLELELKVNKGRIDSMKNELITLISHELRTPVTVVTSTFDLLKEVIEMPSVEKMHGFSDDKKKRLFANIEKGHRRLIDIIEDLNCYLNLSKDTASFDKQKVEMNGFLSNNLSAFKELIAEYQAEISLELSEKSLEADIARDKMTDVLERLIHNAAYHNPAGTQIRLSSASASKVVNGKNQEVVRIEVSDNGRGIERSLLDNIFKPFSITDIDHHSRGLGMGLCICKKIIELHRADIRLDSPSQGRGTRIVIDFPA